MGEVAGEGSISAGVLLGMKGSFFNKRSGCCPCLKKKHLKCELYSSLF